jgi:catechol 2,3-dioxygenase-like lactoylglutathione lyase family enzyme
VRTTSLAVASLTALLLLACGGLDEPAGSPDPADETPGQEAAERIEAPEVPEEPEPGDDPFANFDRDEARSQAESHLGITEDDIEESPMVRIVRRGDEDFAVTMDLRPGRLNLELDDDGSGTYVVTRVVVETPDGELVIE